MQHIYRKLLDFYTIEEKKNGYSTLTERHLQILWQEQKLLRPLKTNLGEVIEVISPGIWNSEAGPDFLKAHLKIGHRNYRGDIEIHLYEDGWYQHGHSANPKYNQVILHLSFWSSSKPLTITKENGQGFFSAYLKDSLKVSVDEIILTLEDRYAFKKLPQKGRCSKELFSIIPGKEKKLFFQSAAYFRLEKKLQVLEQSFLQRSMQFAAGIAMALGYKHNAQAFFELFCFLFPYRDLPYEELLAIMLGCCGFLEEQRKKEWEKSDYYQYLRKLWWGRKNYIIHQIHLKLNRIRPYHHPIRRLVYLARLLQDSQLEYFWSLALMEWEKTVSSQNPNYRELTEKLLEILPNYQNAYWDYHFTFESNVQPKRLPGLGKDIKMHFLLNTILPLLYGTIQHSDNYQAVHTFEAFYQSLEIPLNEQSAYLQQRFFGSQKGNQLRNAQMAQGAYQMYHDFCMQYEASCEGCPFVERYKLNFSQE